MEDWTTKDKIIGISEGWILAHSTVGGVVGRLELIPVPGKGTFETNDQAFQFVSDRMFNGSYLHAKALKHMAITNSANEKELND